MDRLQQLNKQHLQPVIKQLQEPKKAIVSRQIHGRDVDRLIRLKDLMGPFIQDFSRTAHALRHQAFKVYILPTADLIDACISLQWTLAGTEDYFCTLFSPVAGLQGRNAKPPSTIWQRTFLNGRVASWAWSRDCSLVHPSLRCRLSHSMTQFFAS